VFQIITQQLKKSLLPWLEERTRRAGAALFAKPDAWAVRSGWTITQRRGGLSRTYRDPRFDLLIRCTSCGGSGFNHTAARGACPTCGGSGRLVRTTHAEPARR